MIEIGASIKESLRAYYRATGSTVDEREKARVVAMVFEEAARHSAPVVRPGAAPFWRFLVGQLRFVSPLAWAAQVALLVGMLLLVSVYGASESAMLVVMVAAVLSVAMGIPSVFKSFENGVAELETSCCHDSAQVLVSRLVLFGLADVLWMSLAAWLVPIIVGGDSFRVFFYAATPFFSFCTACFYLSRVTRGRCVKACVAAAFCAVMAIWGANAMAPHWYSNASTAVWSFSLVVALALATYEARRLVSQIASGGFLYPALPVRP